MTRNVSTDDLGPDDWLRLEPILDEVLDLDPAHVAARLDRLCAGDSRLRVCVERLLQAERDGRDFMSRPIDLGDEPVPAPQRAGRYVVESELGRGGMGVVYLASDNARGRKVALKVLAGHTATDATRVALFLGEARLLTTLHHPNIAGIHGLERTDLGQRVLVLEYVEGRSLAKRLEGGCRLPYAEALDVARQIARALAEAHARGVAHRDLKPGNVMLTPGGRIKVLDFGVAAHMGPRRTGSAHGAAAATAIVRGGTPGYMSPEQLRGGEETFAVDAFALGCVLYECLCGVPAFARDDREATVAATLGGSVELKRLPPGVPLAVRAFLQRLIAPQPSQRPTLDEAAAQFTEWAGRNERRSESPRRLSPDDLIPMANTRFIGRTRELEECADAVLQSRIVTLTGAGGCGKTRLAVELAHRLGTEDFESIWFVDLTAARDEAGVLEAVLTAIGAAGYRDTASEFDAIRRRLARSRGLVILDNCEHVPSAASAVARRLVDACPRAHVLATSREWLGLPGELVLRVSPLPVPAADVHAEPESIANNDSVRLFVEHARVARPGFAIDATNAERVADVCRALDGIPLALELAAALLTRHDLDDVVARAVAPLAEGTSGERTRHATLMSTIALSYDLLESVQQRDFERLAVFSAGWNLEAAAAVCGDAGDDAFDVLDRLMRLIDHSLVVPDAGHREPRYRFLEPVRAFARSRLEVGTEYRQVLDRHARHFGAVADALAPRLTGGEGQVPALDHIESDHGNFLTAIHARCDEGSHDATGEALRLARSIWRFWYMRGHLRVGRDAMMRVLALPGSDAFPSERASVLAGAGVLSMYLRDDAAALRLCRSALRMHRDHGDVLGEAHALNYLGGIAAQRGQPERARTLFEGARRRYEMVHETRSLALILNNLGAIARQKGDLVGASERFEQALPLARTTRNADDLGLMLVNSALVSVRLGNLNGARERIVEALAVVREAGAKRLATAALEVASEVLFELGHAEDAARSMGLADEVRSNIGVPADGHWRRGQEPFLDRLRQRFGVARYAELMDEGRRGSLTETLDRIQPLVHAG